MPNAIEDAVLAHIGEKSRASMHRLYTVLLSGNLLVPVATDLTADRVGHTDVPARCIRLPNGEGCLPVFTSEERLLEWNAEGSKYAEMPGRTLFKMASEMPEVDWIYVNYSERKSSPKGPISRAEFELLAKGISPTEVPHH